MNLDEEFEIIKEFVETGEALFKKPSKKAKYEYGDEQHLDSLKRSFIKGRTDFLGSNQPASRMKQKIQRNSNNNKFGFNWGWNPANGGDAAPIPSYVININV